MAGSLDTPPLDDAGLGVTLSRYGLNGTPFTSSTDPSVLWRGRAQRELLARFRSGVADNAGVLLLVGEVGTGKSTLIKALLEDLGTQAFTATVAYPKLDPLGFLRAIGTTWGLDGTLGRREDFYDRFPNFLEAAAAHDQRVLLIVDEAQSLSPELLGEIRGLASFTEKAGLRAALNILLVGQEELCAILARPENAELQRRVTVTGYTQPLSDVEVSSYVKHHLRLGGSERVVFTIEAIREITTASRGAPRLINMICDLALLTGARREVDTIDADTVRECAVRLGLVASKTWRSKSRRAAVRRVVVPGALLVLAVGTGYLVGSWQAPEWSGRGPRMPAESATRVPSPAVAGPARPEPEAEPPSPERPPEPLGRPPEPEIVRAPEVPAARSELPPAEPRVLIAPPAPVRPPAPPPRLAAPPLRAAPVAEGPAAGRDQAAASPAGSPARTGGEPSTARTGRARPAEEQGSREDEAADPNAIIDWVLQVVPARRD